MTRSLALMLFLLTAGCVETPGAYPSLAKRPIESRSEAPPKATTPEPAKPDPALDARIRDLTAQLTQADSGFTPTIEQVERAAAAPGSRTVGSNAWLNAQTSLADLEARQNDSLSILTEFERMVTDRGVAGEVPYPALDSARAKAQAQVDAQSGRVAAVRAKLDLK